TPYTPTVMTTATTARIAAFIQKPRSPPRSAGRARRLADRVRSQAPWAAPYLPHTGPIISGETVEPPSHGAARPQTTTTQKDTPA
ncbi:hypothetical protein D0N42_09295, partial [Micrococcus luteus]